MLVMGAAAAGDGNLFPAAARTCSSAASANSKSGTVAAGTSLDHGKWMTIPLIE